MENTEKLKKLIYKDENPIPFLKSLSKKEFKEISDNFRRIFDEIYEIYSEEVTKCIRNKEEACTLIKQQQELINFATPFRSTYKEYCRNYMWIKDSYFEKKLYKKFKPDWLIRYVNEWQGERNTNRIIDYTVVIDLIENNIGTPKKGVIAQILNLSVVPHMYSHETVERKTLRLKLFENPITLNEHIWYLFEYPTEINRGMNDNWIKAFKHLSDTKKIDKLQLLKACLLTSTRNFNTTLTCYFFDVFNELEPTINELLSVQDELFLVFNCPYSKPINVCLKHIKSICTDEQFNINNFLESVPVLLSSEINSVVTNTLMILDRLAKKHQKLQSQICLITSDALLQKHQKIQERASKIIVKYGDVTDEELCSNITTYHSEIFNSVKTVLKEFIINDEANILISKIEVENSPILMKEKEIQIPSSFDDMLFFLAQSFRGNEIFHFDIFLVVLPKIYQQVTNENLYKLEPIFKSAIQKIEIEEYSRVVFTEKLMARQFILCTNSLLEKYPNYTINSTKRAITKIDSSFFTIDFDHKSIFKKLLTNSYDFLTKNTDVELLSTPTHQPCYVDINVFIRKLLTYQQQKKQPLSFDFQIGISRLIIDDARVDESLLNQLTGEYLQIIEYLIDKRNLTEVDFKTTPLWLVAIYRKNDLTSFLKLIDEQKNTTKLSLFTSHLSWLYRKRKVDDTEIIDPYQHQHLHRKEEPTTHTFYDYSYDYFFYEPKLFALSPFQPELFHGYIEQYTWTYQTYAAIANEKQEIPVLALYSKIWKKGFGSASYIYVANRLFDYKPMAQLATDIWIKEVAKDNMDNSLFGKSLGKIQCCPCPYPLKRLTDIIANQLLNISVQHNHALEIVLYNTIINLPEKLLKGTKKLLELYNELLILNVSKVDEFIISKIDTYRQSKNLQTIIKTLSLQL